MKAHVQRRYLLIVPESQQDIAFIEDTLELKLPNDYVVLRRTVLLIANGMGNVIALETTNLPTHSDEAPATDPAPPPDDNAEGEPKTVEELIEEIEDVDDDDDDDDGGGGVPPVVEI